MVRRAFLAVHISTLSELIDLLFHEAKDSIFEGLAVEATKHGFQNHGIIWQETSDRPEVLIEVDQRQRELVLIGKHVSLQHPRKPKLIKVINQG